MDADAPETPEGEKEVADRPVRNMTYAAKAGDTGQDKGVRQYADAPAARIFLKAKLEAMKVQAGKNPEKGEQAEKKRKEEILS